MTRRQQEAQFRREFAALPLVDLQRRLHRPDPARSEALSPWERTLIGAVRSLSLEDRRKVLDVAASLYQQAICEAQANP